MKLIEQIRKDRITAFKAKENIKKDLLGCLIADSCKENKEPEDEKVLSVIKKFIDGAKEMQESTKETDYEFYKASLEIDILSEYRPAQLSETEIRNVMSTLKFQDKKLPEAMKYFKDTFAGRYDGKLVSTIAKEVL